MNEISPRQLKIIHETSIDDYIFRFTNGKITPNKKLEERRTSNIFQLHLYSYDKVQRVSIPVIALSINSSTLISIVDYDTHA